MHKSCHLLEGEPLIPIFDQVTAILILAIFAGGGGLAPLKLSLLCRARVFVQPLAFTLIRCWPPLPLSTAWLWLFPPPMTGSGPHHCALGSPNVAKVLPPNPMMPSADNIARRRTPRWTQFGIPAPQQSAGRTHWVAELKLRVRCNIWPTIHLLCCGNVAVDKSIKFLFPNSSRLMSRGKFPGGRPR